MLIISLDASCFAAACLFRYAACRCSCRRFLRLPPLDYAAAVFFFCCRYVADYASFFTMFAAIMTPMILSYCLPPLLFRY